MLPFRMNYYGTAHFAKEVQKKKRVEGNDMTGHHVLKCPAQIAALAKYVEGIIAELPNILTPLGVMNTNILEVSTCVFRLFSDYIITNTSTVEPCENPQLSFQR